MAGESKIALAIPDTTIPDRYFSFILKQQIYNERTEHKRSKKIFVVSNIRGNFRSLCKILMKAGVVDSRLHWSFDNNRLVILGDCFDWAEGTTECLWLIYSLEERAKRKGGYIHFILGDREIHNMNGNWRYIHPKYAARKDGPTTAMYYGNNELQQWLNTKNIIEKIGDMLFVHGGITNELLRLDLSADDCNQLARSQYNYKDKIFNDPRLSLIYGIDTSPFSYSGYSQTVESEKLVDATLPHFGVKTVIIGHRPGNKVESLYNGKVINVNADSAPGICEGLLIRRDDFYSIPIDGERVKLI